MAFRDPFMLEDKTVLVTGSIHGLGKKIALVFAEVRRVSDLGGHRSP